MDKQQITRQLQRLAQEEIAEDMNLWPRIQGQLKRKAKPRSLSLAPVLSVFVMLILVSVGGYAAYQTAIPEATITADEVSQFNLVQTVGGVTAILDWVYADAQIITVQYSILYNSAEVRLPDYSTTYLSTTDGLQIPQDFGGGGGGGGGSDSMTRMSNQVSFNANVIEGNPESLNLLFQVVYGESFEAPYLSEQMPTMPPPDSIDFGAAVTAPPFDYGFATGTPIPFGEFQATVPPDTVLVTPMSIITATPFGDFQPTVPPPANLTIEPSLIPPMQFTPTPIPATQQIRFNFSFNVPFHPAKTGAVENDRQVVDGIGVSVQNVRVTPLMTSFDLCYDLPDLVGEWTPKVSVESDYAPLAGLQNVMELMSLDGQKRYNMNSFSLPMSAANGGCSAMSGSVPFGAEVGELDIVVDYLYRSVDASDAAWWAGDEVFFFEQGFNLSYAFVPLADEAETSAFFNQSFPHNVLAYPLPDEGALLITVRDYPQQLDEWQAHQYIYDHLLRERVLGPWRFHVVVGD